jgi:hypothetical protein
VQGVAQGRQRARIAFGAVGQNYQFHAVSSVK